MTPRVSTLSVVVMQDLHEIDAPQASADFVVLVGGPRNGWAYKAKNIESIARSEIYFGREWFYLPTGEINYGYARPSEEWLWGDISYGMQRQQSP